MPVLRFVVHPSGQRSLDVLLEELRSARQDVGRLRCTPHDRRGLLEAQQSLLVAMESYAAALTERGLPTPWKLRDELRLQRSIGGRHDAVGGRG